MNFRKKATTKSEANEKIEYLKSEKDKLNSRVSELNTEVANLKEEAGDVALSDALEGTSNSGNKFRTLRNKESERDAKLQAISKLDAFFSDAQTEKIEADASEKRQEADSLENQAAKIESKRAKLLEQLQEVEGCEFVPFVRTMPPAGTAVNNATASKYITPRSEVLRMQAERLNSEAKQLESRAQSAKRENVAFENNKVLQNG